MKNIIYYNALEQKHPVSFSEHLLNLFPKATLQYEIIILCIGSDRSTGDSLGPLVGHKLQKSLGADFFIYGTLKNPVHALNLEETLKNIYRLHFKPFIIAIDASLGEQSHIGYVTLSNSPLSPGLGVKKSLPKVGDLCITGIVNFSGYVDSSILQSTRLSIVMELADFISKGIYLAARTYSSSSITCISR